MATYSSQTVGFGWIWARIVAAAFKTDPGAALVATPKVRLSADPGFNPTKDSTIAELVTGEIDFDGYPAGGFAATVSDPVNLSALAVGVQLASLFLMTIADPAVGGTAIGYWVDDGTNVIAYERFPAGSEALFAVGGDFLELLVRLPVRLSQSAA